MPDEATGTTEQQPHDDFDIPADTGTTAPDTAAPTETETETPPQGEQFPPELLDALAAERLPAVPGETTMAAYARLATHLRGRNRQLYNTLKEDQRTRNREMQELRASLDPILRDHYHRQRQAQLEAEEAEIPPRDSPEYQVWLNEQILRRMDDEQRQKYEAAQTQEQLEAQQAVQQRLAVIDESGYSKVAEGLGLVQGVEPDQDFAVAYDVYSEAATLAARAYFPEASDDQIQEFVALSQQLEIRRAEMNGVDIRHVMKTRMDHLIDSLVRRGAVVRAAKTAPSNGQQQQTTPQQTRATEQPTQTQGVNRPRTSTAEQVRADAAAAQRRSTSAVPSATRPSATSTLPDPSDMEEEEYVEAAMAGLLGSEEQRTSRHRRNR